MVEIMTLCATLVLCVLILFVLLFLATIAIMTSIVFGIILSLFTYFPIEEDNIKESVELLIVEELECTLNLE